MNEILNYFVKSLAAKSLTLKKKSILIEKPWALIDDDGEIQKLIFKRDKGLILSKNGVVTIGSWDYYPEARALLIDRNTDKLLLKEQYIDDNVLILKKDGTDNDFFALANENTLPDYNVPKYLNSLKCKEFGIYETKLLNGYILQIHGGPRYQLYNGLNGHDVTQIDNNNYNSIDLNDGAYMTEDKKYTLYIQDGKTASIKINFLKKLANGDIVEILTSSQSNGPSRDWLNIVKSSQAKNKIRQWFKKEAREDNILKGREMLEKEIKRAGYFYKTLIKQEYLDSVLKRLNINDTDDLFAAIGYGGVTANLVLQRILEEYRKDDKNADIKQKLEYTKKYEKREKTLEKGVKVKGVDNLLIRFSKCCSPVPGDEIIGYITRGRGISVHRKDCPNAIQHFDERERLIEVEWDESRSASYNVEIQVSAVDRGGLLSDVINTINELKTVIIAVNARTNKNKVALIDMTLQIKNKEHLQTIIQKLKRVKDVISVNRILPN